MKYLFILLALIFPCLSNGQGSTQSTLCLPSITTDASTAVGLDSALIGGNITNDGGNSIVLRGVCYSTSPNPNMGNSRTEEGSGIGMFSSILRNLSPSTTYYARTYAKNSNGVVVYGNEVSFTTNSNTPAFTCGTSTVSDVDGNSYNTVQIGTQCWTQSNLKVSKYRNGDSISTGLSDSDWANTTSGAYAIYNNDPVNDGLYGKLYNHYAVMDSRGLCPTGWHVPTNSEWNVMVKYLDPNADTVCSYCWQSGIAGGALKSTAIQPTPGGWDSPNTGATNSSGFSAGPGGRRQGGGIFDGLGNFGQWWSSSSYGSLGWRRYLNYDDGGIGRSYGNRTIGVSVRCLRGWGISSVPTVTTENISGVSAMAALTGGNISSDGGALVTSRGVAYGLVPSPTTSGTITNDGIGTGVFTSTLTGLTASTTYYVRAYAINGFGTAYGNEVSFTTPAISDLRCPGTPSVTDIDGNVYNTVQIGTQCWTQSNLKVSKYQNGDSISTGLSNSAWELTTAGAYAFYDNDPVNDGPYGKLYNHYAVMDSRGLCPTGWHVPMDYEWSVMVKHLDPNADTGTAMWPNVGGLLKSTAIQPTPGGWLPPNVGATNSSGFSAGPGGLRYGGYFGSLGYSGFWWSSSSYGSFARIRYLNYNNGFSYRGELERNYGFSVRCLWDWVLGGGGTSSVPTVTTENISGVTVMAALTGGNISSDGGVFVTSRGVAYGLVPSPTTSGTITNDGIGTGVFTSTLTGLTASTTYYVRAYAINAVGTAYGNEVSFTTPSLRCPGTQPVTDIDGNVYNTVPIGTQCWTQSNLKVSKYRNGDSIPTGLSNSGWGSTTIGAYAIYDNNPVNDGLYGKLYNHYAVMDSRGLCPTGWHVPTDGEWNLMVKFLDPNADTICNNCTQSGIAGGALKSTATQPTPGGWASPNGGATNSSGFTAGPGGLRGDDANFAHLGFGGYYWSSSSSSGSDAWFRSLGGFGGSIHRYNPTRPSGFSVRCIRDVIPSISTAAVSNVTATSATTGGNVTQDGGAPVTARGVAYGTTSTPTTSGAITNEGPGTGTFNSNLTGLTPSNTYYVRAYATNGVGTAYGNEISFSTNTSNGFSSCGGVTDVDGNSYQTVQIGTQCWTQSNLKVSKYRNGDSILTELSNTAWQSTTSGAYAIYNNDPVNDGIYGKLYNHFTVTDTRGLCPTGWHVPTDGEWTTLETFLGGSSVAGGALKSTAILPTPGGWNPSNTGATNSSGFTARSCGLRHDNGPFGYLGSNIYLWSSSLSSTLAWARYLNDADSTMYRNIYTRTHGFSVRCLRD